MQDNTQLFQVQHLRILKDTQTAWSYQMLSSLNEIYNQEIRESLAASSTLEQFMQKHEDKILDVINRKEDLYSYFELIKNNMKQMADRKNQQLKQMQRNGLKKEDEQYKQLKDQNKKFKQMHKNCSFQEFMNLLIFANKQKAKLAANLMDLKCPIPILYQLGGRECVYDPYVLRDIFFKKDSHLIFHLRSQNAYDREKEMVLKKMFSMNQSYFRLHQKKNYLNIFVLEKYTVADLSCEGLSNKEGTGKQQFTKNLYQILRLNSLIMLLVTEEDVKNNFLRMNTLIQKACQSKYKLLILCITKNVQDPDSDSDSEDSNASILQKKILEQLPSDNHSNLHIEIIALTLDTKKASNIYKSFINMLDSEEKKLSYSNFCQLTIKQKIMKYQTKMEKIMRQLKQKKWTKKDMLPHMFLKQKIYEQKGNFNMFDFDRKQKIVASNQKISKLDKQIQSLSLSQFVSQLLDQWADQTFRAILLFQLKQWKKSYQPHLVCTNYNITQQIRQINNRKLTQTIDFIPNKSEFDITIEKIANEIVAYNTKVNSPDQEKTKLIKDFYSHALKNNNPLNLIDGASLQFGNQYLYETLQQISKQYRQKNKEIYVVSVVGAQSSAKSTLLKYLFGSNFQIGAGRCTKGVYFGICQVENMVIVVIDTEGLLSPVGRDKVFDQQIMTFVLKFSNVIILNCKGQLSATIRDMLELCMYVISLINKSENNIDNHPKRLIFVLRDQLKPNNQIQNEMLAIIMDNFQNLRDQYNLNYTDYFKIDINDIISLPSAFDEKQGINYSITPNVMFGQYILFLRNIIVNRLKEQQNHKKRDLESVYKEGQNLWSVIQSCGRDLMYFNQLFQAKQIQRLQSIYYKMHSEKLEDFQTKFEEKFKTTFEGQIKKLQSLEDVEALKEIQNLKKNIQQMLIKLKSSFRTDFEKQCSVQNNLLLRPFYKKIQEFVASLKYSRQLRLAEKKRKLLKKLWVQPFKSKMNEEIYKTIHSDSKQRMIQFKKLMQNMIGQIKYQKKQIIDEKKQFYIRQINEVLNQIYSIPQVRESIKINSILECFVYAKKWRNLTKAEDINDQILSNWKQILEKKNSEDFQINFVSPWQSIEQCFYGSSQKPIYLKSMIEKTILALKNFIGHQNFLVEPIRKIVTEVYIKMENSLQSLQQQIMKQFKNKNAKLSRLNIKKLLLGCTFQQLIDFQDFEIQEIYQAYIKEINSKKQLLQCMLNTQKSFQQKIEMIQQTIVKNAHDQSINFYTHNINLNIGILVQKLKVDIEKIKQQGIKRSIKLEDNGKYKWKQCFKFICNQKKFLLELICKNKKLTKHNAFMNQRKKQTKLYAQKYLDTYIQILTNKQTVLSYLKDKFYLEVPESESEQIRAKIYKKINQKIKEKMLNKIFGLLEQNKQFSNERQIKEKIQKKISQEMVGCHQQCPICFAKCKKSYNHQGDHEVYKDGHLMKAFAGIQYKNSGNPSIGTCFTLPEINRKFNSRIRKYENNIQFISTQHPKWLEHFNDKSLYQTVKNQANLQKIWANVSDMLIKYKFTKMVQNNIFADRKQDELTEQDLDKKYENYLGDEISLRDYL